MNLAAVDGLAHQAVIMEMKVESYRQRAAAKRQKQRTAGDNDSDTKEMLIPAPAA